MSITNILSAPFKALAGKIDATVEQRVIMSVARTVAKVVGSSLVTYGYVASSDAEMIVGALTVVIATVASGLEKKYSQK